MMDEGGCGALRWAALHSSGSLSRRVAGQYPRSRITKFLVDHISCSHRDGSSRRGSAWLGDRGEGRDTFELTAGDQRVRGKLGRTACDGI